MSDPSTIYLRNIFVLSPNGQGNVSSQPMEIPVPTACSQKNAKGNLKSFDNFSDWKASARESGARFRRAFDFLGND